MRNLLSRRMSAVRAAICAMAALALSAPADNLAWSFGSASPFSDVPDAAVPNLTVGSMTRGNEGGTIAMLSISSPSATTAVPPVPAYTGATGTGNAQIVCKAGAFDAGVSSYYEITLTPEVGYTLTVTEFSFGTRRTGTGPVNYSLRHSGDGYANPIVSGATPASSTWGLLTHTGFTFTAPGAVTLRLYGHDGAGAVSAANWRIDDLQFTLSVSVGGANPPTISDFSPQSGTPGTVVTITGTEFGSNPVVRFNGTTGTGTTVNPEGTSITTTVPAAATTGPLTVNGPGGQATGLVNFTVVPLPQLGVSVAPSSFAENAANPAAFGTVTLPAPLGFDFTVSVTSSAPGAATVPPTVVIPTGQTSAQFDVTAVPNPGSFTDTTATITVSAGGYQDGTTTVTVTNTDAPQANVVINKYLNTGGSTGDIVELLVVGDGTSTSTADLRGAVIKDFSSSMGSDGGGKYRFNDIPLFNGLKAGTLVVITDGGSAATTDTDASDYVIKLGLTDTAYFTSAGGGDFDISTTEMIMIKSPGAPADGVTGSMHVLAGGNAGTQFNNATGRKLRSELTASTGRAVVANNATSSLADFDAADTTKATGNVSLTAADFGTAHNATNNAFIQTLRGNSSVDGLGSAVITNLTSGSPYVNRRFFARSSPDQTVSLDLIGSGPAATVLSSVKITVPAAFGTPVEANTIVSGAGLGAGTVTFSGQDITITGAYLTPNAGINVTFSAITTPDTAGITNDGRYFFTIQTAGDGGVLKDISSHPAALVVVPVANLRDVDANGLPADLNKVVAIEVVCTEDDFDSAVRTSAYGQDGDHGINIFIQGVELNLVTGNRYAITGPVIQFSGLTEISPASAADVIDLGVGTLPAPLVTTIANLLATPEAFEGRLVRVNGLTRVSGNWLPSSTIGVSDATGALDIRIQSGSSAFTTPSFPINVTGIFGQFDGTSPYTTGYQIMPRTDADVESLGVGAYYDWANLYGVGGPQEDSDGDGVPNMVEYATGTLPNDALSSNPPVFDYTARSFTVNKGEPGASDASLQYIVEASTDLTNWNTNDLSEAENTSARLSVLYLGNAPRVYFRLKLVRP